MLLTDKAKFGAAVFTIMAASLMLQIIITRILSAISWYHLAFFVIGVAMFGLSAGGVWVYLRKEKFTPQNLTAHLALNCILFACSALISSITLIAVTPLLGFADLQSGLAGALLMLVVWLLVFVGLGLPFVFSGIVASLALTRSRYNTPYVYAVDLIGAAFGCLIVLALLMWVDGVSAIILTALLGLVASMLFTSSDADHTLQDLSGWHAVLMNKRGLLAAFTLVLAVSNIGLDGALRPWASKGHIEVGDRAPAYIKWNSFSRITATPTVYEGARLWGPSPNYNRADWQFEQRLHMIDGDAGTYVYKLPDGVASAGFLDYDLTTLAYHAKGIDSAAIVGMGGGRDLLSAKYFGVEDVTGVEINNILIDLLFGDNQFSEFAGINRLDGITIVHDEARNWFARTDHSFDLVQMSLIDTWAATGAGAFTLSENALYTVEGWETFMSKVSDDGVFSVSRWFNAKAPYEVGRLISLAMAAGFELGMEDPSQHIYVATSDKIATLVMSKKPFGLDTLTAYDAWLDTRAFNILLSPAIKPSEQVLNKIVSAKTPAELALAVTGHRYDLSPPVDNRPFFFNQLPFSAALGMLSKSQDKNNQGVITGNLLATKTLIVLLIVTSAFVLSCLIWPMRQGLGESSVAVVFGGSSYFSLIGFGFMFVEIGLMQRFSIFLGHPTYSLGITLFSLILTTGCGSALATQIKLNSNQRVILWALATFAYLAFLALFSDNILNVFQSTQFFGRCLITIGLILPAGLLMGFAFPTGMHLVELHDKRPTPWFWGLNGAAGVLASVIAVIMAIAYGIDKVLVIGAFCYLMLIPTLSLVPFSKEKSKG